MNHDSGQEGREVTVIRWVTSALGDMSVHDSVGRDPCFCMEQSRMDRGMFKLTASAEQGPLDTLQLFVYM